MLKAKQTRINEIDAACAAKEQDAFERGSKRAEVRMEEANARWGELFDVLNLPRSSSIYDAGNAVAELRRGLSSDREVARLKDAINSIGRVVNKAAAHPSGTVSLLEIEH
ncbi:hypothetical protein [Rhizobium sp. Rhizsp82]|uniref:hypothetical protein n=1 Tax=Rhizobium sp. Rhizsp82 TaxID=3243057 RepID=UPI0039B6110C